MTGYVASIIGVAAMTGLIAVVPGADHTANVSLLYLLVVMATAFIFGRGPAVFTRMAENAPLLAAGMNEPPFEQARCLLNGL